VGDIEDAGEALEAAADAAREAADAAAQESTNRDGIDAVIGAAASGRGRGNSFSRGRSGAGVGFMLFILGLFTGLPMAFFGFDYFVTYSAGFFGFLLGLLGTTIAILIFALVFRRPIWERLYKRGEVEVEKMAAPLANVAKHAAAKRLDDATDAAKDLAEMVLARYAWLTTRRWIIGSITGLLAAIAALAGSTLLFQQNTLLAEQSVLIQGQTDRLDEQNFLLETQISLAEAERSALIGPEILNIADAIGEETAKLAEIMDDGQLYFLTDLSPGLRGRIIALTNLARPYRYLVPGEIDPRDENAVLQKALRLRPDILRDKPMLGGSVDKLEKIKLIDQPLSPERGQILSILLGTGIRDTELLSYFGADFSFAELRMETLGVVSYKHANLNFAKFADMNLYDVQFRAADLNHANFSGSIITKTNFGGLAASDVKFPYSAGTGLPYFTTSLTGANFSQAVITNSDLSHIIGMVINFEDAALYNVNFDNSALNGTIFKNTILVNVSFKDALLKPILFDGAIVFEADFLDRVSKQVGTGGFVSQKWQLQTLSFAKLSAHPNFIPLSNYISEQDMSRQAYRITRNPQFTQ